MFKKNLINTIGEIKTPERKLNVLMPVLAVFALAGVVYFLFNIISDNSKQISNENAELRKENRILLHLNDSLIFKLFDDKQENIKQLQRIIDNQNEQKKLLK